MRASAQCKQKETSLYATGDDSTPLISPLALHKDGEKALIKNKIIPLPAAEEMESVTSSKSEHQIDWVITYS